ncbi:hypothetical protein BC939DRAFT_445274 [Gamsiella multidivaricata]|uniref:uncharacterized protein n=1 Tax=Gamsiella multidivaricata TaxID=101098 RepID=UPI00221E604E|nr:uncharacterized protein BC939DRAFT_445274 [Gamsiella multidivaricata]KAI7827447.1 hypothetical protein BC939DRAFT_445274 [Gamsiella multidivaricata]
MTTLFIDKNPLHIPEIRSRISRLVSVKDAISCVRVSKDWSNDFVFPIWYAIDFKVHNTFEQLSADIVAKHGHHIRIVEDLKTQLQLNALLSPSIKNIRVLRITCASSARFRTLCMDLISRNNSNLRKLSLGIDVNANQRDLSFRMIFVDALVPHSSVSRLSSVRLHGICLSRNSFASLLRGCPLLTRVDLQQDVALLSGSSIDTFQHTRVATLTAPISQVFKPDPESEPSPPGSSLLAHFPNLTYWHVYNQVTTLVVPIKRIKAEVRMCCPKVTQIGTWVTPSPVLYDLVANVFRNLVSVTFAYKELSTDVIIALTFHNATLLDISTFWDVHECHTERDHFPREDDYFQSRGRALQLLPRSCLNLQILGLERHEMDMDHVEESEWACKRLQELRVRIRELDTKEKVKRALQLWKEGRKKNETDVMDEERKKVVDESNESHVKKEDTSIEARVAKHLLTFDKLKAVWLGTRTCYS